jgi:hypothetical protein
MALGDVIVSTILNGFIHVNCRRDVPRPLSESRYENGALAEKSR